MRKISRCLNPQLVNICLQSFQVDKINDIFQSMIPEYLQPHCRVASFVKGKLSIAVDDACFATELRFLIPDIRDGLRRDHQLYRLMQCEIIIDSQHADPILVPKKQLIRKSDSKATDAVTALADGLSYEPLKQAVSRWANHLKK